MGSDIIILKKAVPIKMTTLGLWPPEICYFRVLFINVNRSIVKQTQIWNWWCEEVKLDKIIIRECARSNYNFWWWSEIILIICLDSSHLGSLATIYSCQKTRQDFRYPMILMYIFYFSFNIISITKCSLVIVSVL